MRLRRCAVLLIEPRESIGFDLDSLLAGGDGLAAGHRLLALAPHLDREVELVAGDADVLAAVPVQRWTELAVLQAAHEPAVLARLLDCGLLLSDDDTGTHWRERDERLRATGWHPHAAVAQLFGRWSDVKSGEAAQQAGYATLNELLEKLGPPPPTVGERSTAAQRMALALPPPNAFDALLRRRVTCRNFDPAAYLDNELFCTMLHRVFGAQAMLDIMPGNSVMKRNSPSGGGLHPTEAYLLVQRVQGVAPGLYHYHPVAHALEPLASPASAELGDFALRCVAAQRYLADAPVLVMLVSRFARSFWKYRSHAKAHRVVVLDAGHLSQNLYLSATELGLGAFVTAAINETAIERAFGLDPLHEGVLAVCGFGMRGNTQRDDELDPLHTVWPREADHTE